MNKLISKIVGVCLGLSLATGVGIGVAMGQDASAVQAASGDSYTFTATSGTSTDGNWSFTSAKNSGSTAPAYSSSQLRLYPGNSITFTAGTGLVFTSASFSCVINKNKKNVYPSDWDVDNGTIDTYDTSLTSFDVTSIDSNSFTITIYGSAGNVGLTSVEMSYGSGGSTTYTSVTVSEKTPLTGTFKGSAYYVCDSEVEGTGAFSEDVTWSITSSSTYGTGTTVQNLATIDQTGKIIFANNGTVYAWATAADEETHNTTGFAVTASGLIDVPFVTNPLDVSTAKVYSLSNDAVHFATNTVSNKTIGLTESAEDENGLFCLEETTGGYHLRIVSYSNSKYIADGKYVNNNSGTDISLADSGSSVWTLATDLTAVYLTNSSNSSRHLGLNDARTGIKAYASANIAGNMPVYLYEVGSLSTLVCDSIELTGAPSSLSVGETATLGYYALDEEAGTWQGAVTYASSNTSVATIDGNVLTAVAAGNTNITVTAVGAGAGGVDVVSDPVAVTVTTSDFTTDTITIADTPVTSYSLTTGIQKTGHPAVYASYNTKSDANHGNVLQYRSNDSLSGIVSTTTGGLIQTITIDFQTAAQMDIYAKNTPYEAPADLYDASKCGTKVGNLSSNGTFTFADDYAYVGIRSSSGARYVNSIQFVWATDDPTAPKITIDQAGSELVVGNSGTYTATKQNADIEPIIWSSSNSSVIEINESTGAYVAKKIGQTVITATLGTTGKQSTIDVTVTGTVSVAEAIHLIDELPSSITSDYAVTVYGTVKTVTGDGTKSQFNELVLTDGTNDITIFFGFKVVDNWDTCAIVDNVVSVKGNLCLYGGETYEVSNSHNLALRNTDAIAVDNFISTYMHMTDYDPDLDNSQGNNSCLGPTGYYITAKAALTALSASQIALFQSDDGYNSAQARYEAWALAYGDQTPYSTEVTSARGMLTGVTNNTTVVAAILVVMALTVTTAGAYFFLRKKKEEK